MSLRQHLWAPILKRMAEQDRQAYEHRQLNPVYWRRTNMPILLPDITETLKQQRHRQWTRNVILTQPDEGEGTWQEINS